MYIRANEGLGQGPLHYRVGDATPFLNQVEQGEPKPCKPRFFVTHFLPGSSKLLRLHRKIIGDIAKNVVRFLQSQKVQAGIKGKAM
jgi:hypothetical protein